MAVTKQTYTAAATWTHAQLADLFRDAFIDAGLMTAWHNEFVVGSNPVRVLKIDHDNTKTYGSVFYWFLFPTSGPPTISITSGWNTSTNLPTGTQFLDYHVLPNDTNAIQNWGVTRLVSFVPATNTQISLDRFTSANDTKQNWFVLRQGTNRSDPFTVLHKNTLLHSWLDLNKGIVNGFTTIGASVFNRQGYIDFRLQENIRRCLLTGITLRGDTTGSTSSNGRFHAIDYRMTSYVGLGSQSNSTANNYSSPANGGAVILPVGKTSANPEFTTDYVPICSELPWSNFTPTNLANDFGIYMHYADNTIAYADKFIVSAGVNEWEVLNFANNAVVIDGASPTFLARVV